MVTVQIVYVIADTAAGFKAGLIFISLVFMSLLPLRYQYTAAVISSWS